LTFVPITKYSGGRLRFSVVSIFWPFQSLNWPKAAMGQKQKQAAPAILASRLIDAEFIQTSWVSVGLV